MILFSKGKKAVIECIKQNVKSQLEFLGNESNILKREMEQQELNAFKSLTEIKNKETLDKVITQLNYMGDISYILAEEMYKQELSASSKVTI